MTDDTAIENNEDKRLGSGSVLARLGTIGGVLVVITLIFAFIGGWLSPQRLTQRSMVAAFRQVGGDHPGFRLNHAKGLCVTGWFDSSGGAATVSKAAVFKPGKVPLTGRFSLAGGMAFQPDKPGTVRGLGLRFLPAGAQEWRIATLNIPVFPVNSARGFYDQLLATQPDPATGKPDPAKMQVLLASHPEMAKALPLIGKRPVSAGFADSTYNGLNAFFLVSSEGVRTPVRWSLLPLQPSVEEAAPQPASTDYLFEALSAQSAQHSLQWRLVLWIGQPGDPITDPTLPWPSDRAQIEAGKVIIEHLSSEDAGACDDTNFDPTVVPAGIEASDDELLSTRSSVYAASFTLRSGQQHEKPPGAVKP